MIMPSQKSSYQLPCDMRHATLPVIVEKKKVAYPGNIILPTNTYQNVSSNTYGALSSNSRSRNPAVRLISIGVRMNGRPHQFSLPF